MQKIVVQSHLNIKLEARFSSSDWSSKAVEIPKFVVSQVDIAQLLHLLRMFACNHNYPSALLQNETLKQIAQAILDQLPDEQGPRDSEPRKPKRPKETNPKKAANKKERIWINWLD